MNRTLNVYCIHIIGVLDDLFRCYGMVMVRVKVMHVKQ